jgi:hypothetical protein
VVAEIVDVEGHACDISIPDAHGRIRCPRREATCNARRACPWAP